MAKRMGKTAMAKEIGVSLKTLSKHLKKDGAPESDGKRRFDLEEVRAFVEAEQMSAGGTMNPEYQQLIIDHKKLVIAALERKAAKEDRELLSAKEVEELLLHLGTEFGGVLDRVAVYARKNLDKTDWNKISNKIVTQRAQLERKLNEAGNALS